MTSFERIELIERKVGSLRNLKWSNLCQICVVARRGAADSAARHEEPSTVGRIMYGDMVEEIRVANTFVGICSARASLAPRANVFCFLDTLLAGCLTEVGPLWTKTGVADSIEALVRRSTVMRLH